MFKAYGDKNRAKQAVKPQGNNQTGVLYYRVGKNGTETNFLQWFKSWKDYKITEFDAEYRDALRELKRKEYNIEDELKVLQYEPEIPITKDYWTPDAGELTLLTQEPDATTRGYLEKSMFADWAKKQLILNAEIKTKNDNLKKMRDEIIARGGEARKTMISTIIGKVLADMTEDSRQRILQWKRTEKKDPNDPQTPLTADDMEQAYTLQDWLLVFEIAMVTHLHVDQAVDDTAMLQRQEMQLEKLKRLKHESGSLEKWLLKFEDQLEVCDALGCKVTDHTKRLYLMENLNSKIFEQTLMLWKSTLQGHPFQQHLQS